jgi:hypothetical protein
MEGERLLHHSDVDIAPVLEALVALIQPQLPQSVGLRSSESSLLVDAGAGEAESVPFVIDEDVAPVEVIEVGLSRLQDIISTTLAEPWPARRDDGELELFSVRASETILTVSCDGREWGSVNLQELGLDEATRRAFGRT